MKHTIYYENSRGDVLDFTSPLPNPYRMVTGEMMGYEWGYNASEDYRLRGEKITAFRQAARVMELSLDVFAATEPAYVSAVNRLHDVTDYDIAALKPGRLFVDGSYLYCYIYANRKEQWESPALFMSVTLSLVAEFPAWWTEAAYSFSIIQHSEDDLPDEFVLADDVELVDYPFDYVAGSATTRIIDNTAAYQSSDFLMQIHGPAHNPTVTIGGVIHTVTLELEVQQMLEINSYERTIVKRNVLSGTESNVFGSGSSHVFDPLPAGRFAVHYSGQFAFDLILRQRRAEPLWTF